MQWYIIIMIHGCTWCGYTAKVSPGQGSTKLQFNVFLRFLMILHVPAFVLKCGDRTVILCQRILLKTPTVLRRQYLLPWIILELFGKYAPQQIDYRWHSTVPCSVMQCIFCLGKTGLGCAFGVRAGVETHQYMKGLTWHHFLLSFNNVTGPKFVNDVVKNWTSCPRIVGRTVNNMDMSTSGQTYLACPAAAGFERHACFDETVDVFLLPSCRGKMMKSLVKKTP